MKVQKPKLLKELPQICDILEILQIAKLEEKEIEELHIKGSYLVGEDISGIRFSNILFENVRLNECNFRKCTFLDVKFINCDLSNCDLGESYFNRCEFLTDKLLGAKFPLAVMKDVTIAESNFELVDLNGASMNVAELINSNFRNASLTECKFKNLLCDNVEFIQTNFFRTSLKGMDFTKSNITGIIVSDTGTELKGAKVDLYQAAELAKLFGVIIL